MIPFDRFEAAVTKAGLEAVKHSPLHWQIRGGKFTVNFYPTTSTIYVNGTHSNKACKKRGSVAQAIALANEPPPVRKATSAKAKRVTHSRSRTVRKRLLRKDPHCHWCGAELDITTATLEHIIPLARGGSNGNDNLTLACRKCNHGRGHDMPEMESE